MGHMKAMNRIPPLAILQDLEDAVCCFTPDGVITYANPGACAAMSVPAQDLAGNRLDELYGTQVGALFQQAARQISYDDPVFEYDNHPAQPDPGHAAHWYRWKIRGIFNRQRQLEILYAIGRETQAAAFHRLPDIAPACIFIVQERRYCYVNDFFIHTMGYETRELMVMNGLDLIHQDYRTLLSVAMERLERGHRGMVRLDIQVLPRDGSPRWVDLCASRFEWDGKPAVLGAAYDITRRIQLQTALMQSEGNFRGLADTAPTLIFVVNQGGLAYFNETFLDQTGYTEEECLQMELWEFFHPQHWDMIQTMAQARKSGHPVSGRFQTRMLPKDGRESWADFSLSPFTFNGQPASIGVAIDITEQKKPSSRWNI